MRRYIGLALLLVLGGGIFLLARGKAGEDKSSILHVAEEVPLNISVALPERQAITQIVQAPGDVEATLEVEIRSEIMARIDEMPVDEGSVVRKGDLLCRLNNDNLLAEVASGEARVRGLKAAISNAEADLEQAQRDHDRQMRLSEVDATSDKERLDYITVLKKAEALLDMRKQELVEAECIVKRLQEDLKKTVIESPIDGVVSKRFAKTGEVVVTGTMNNPGTVVMTVSDLSKMQVRARVDEVDVPLVKPDQPARLYLQADQNVPIPAKVSRVASKSTKEVGRDVVTFETLLEVLSDDPRIRPGMTANVEIEVARKSDAITIPIEAIVHRMRKELPENVVEAFDRSQSALALSERARAAQYIKVAYIVQDDVARVRLVTPGISDTHLIELQDGVLLEDVVVIGPYRSLDQLKDGRKVKLSDDEKKKLADAREKRAKEEPQTHLAGGEPAKPGEEG